MNGKDIFLGLKYIGDDLIEKAEYGEFPTKAEKTEKKANTRKLIRRPFLIAAIIATMLLLVGCAVVYLLSMQDVKIAEVTETKDYRLVNGIYVEDPHEVKQNVLTLAGLKGTSVYQACADFYTFKEEYTSNMEAMMNAGTLPEDYFDNNTYGQAMDDKAVELAAKYSLKPEGKQLDFRTTRTMCDALGIERFVQESGAIKATVSSGSCYDTGNFYLNLNFNFPEDQGYEVLSTSGALRWNRTDCFSRDHVAIADSGDWIERNYTTTSGSDVLILQSPSQERGYIICDRGEALMTLQLDVNIEILSEEGGVVSAQYQHMTDRQIELVADTVDFAVNPRIPTQEDVDNQAAISQSATQNGWTICLKSVETDGYVARVTVGVIAPEGTLLPTEGNIIFGNHGAEMVPVNGEITGGGGTIESIDDGDGLDNTMDLLLVRDYSLADGSVPFSTGAVWNLHIVDLEYSHWDFENLRMYDDTLAEGEWLFPITFDETNSDYRELELIPEPIKLNACIGWKEDGTDVLEEFTASSFKLRKFSSELEWDRSNAGEYGESADFYCWTNHFTYAIMNDGTKIDLLRDRNYKPVDLEEVSHVVMADGTILKVSGRALGETSQTCVLLEPEGIELLSGPIEYHSLAGYAEGLDGVREPLYETLSITSILLDSTGVTLPGSPWLDSTDSEIRLVMKDGSKITLTGTGEGPYETPMSRLTAAKTIDVTQVDHLILSDGTELPVP